MILSVKQYKNVTEGFHQNTKGTYWAAFKGWLVYVPLEVLPEL